MFNVKSRYNLDVIFNQSELRNWAISPIISLHFKCQIQTRVLDGVVEKKSVDQIDHYQFDYEPILRGQLNQHHQWGSAFWWNRGGWGWNFEKQNGGQIKNSLLQFWTFACVPKIPSRTQISFCGKKSQISFGGKKSQISPKWRRHAAHRKHSRWNIFVLARITKSFFVNTLSQAEHRAL